MNFNDILVTNMIINSINSITKINTGYLLLDIIYMGLAATIAFLFFNSGFKNKVYHKIESFYHHYDKTNSITFSSNEKSTSKRFKAIMFWISKQSHPTVKKLLEIIETKYSRKTDDYEETKQNCYRVNQNTKFEIAKDIYGKISYREKETTDSYGKTKHEEVVYLDIFSKRLNLIQLQKWVEDRNKEYESHVRTKASSEQLLVEIGWNSKEKNLDIYYNPWSSNATFSNRFFTGKEDILKKIDFFVSNPDWYSARGLPWTLGFLIWGKPGCGKTGFIKALLNFTGRHGITIKLNDKFDLKKLKEVIYDEEISDSLIIPQDKKIIILEDIDCMGELTKDRDLHSKSKNKTKVPDSNSEISEISDLEEESDETIKKVTKHLVNKVNLITKKDNENENNNLSYLLNILDGLQECPGRIIIMTTNKPEVLDSALVREGRVDYKIEFTHATTQDVINIVRHYWSGTTSQKELSKALVNITEEVNKLYSHASVVNMCRSSESIEETVSKIIKKTE